MPEAEVHTNIPDSLWSVNWSDGGIGWLQAMVKEEVQEQMARCQEFQGKHARNNSLNHQPADLAASFRTFKHANKKKRKCGEKSASRRLRNFFRRALEDAKWTYGLDLGSVKTNSFVDFVERIPELLQKAYIEGVIEESFMVNGMADRSSATYPDLYAMVQTIKCNVPDGFLDQVLIHFFARLYKEMKETGTISEATFNEMGVPKDLNDDGEEVPMTAGITREWGQRCKIASSDHQRRLRREEVAAAEDSVRTEWLRKRENHGSVLELNRFAEKKLHLWRKRPETSSRNWLVDVSLEDLFSLSASEVKAFVQVRTCTAF